MPVAQWRRTKPSAVAAGVAAGALVPGLGGLGLVAAAALGVHYAVQRARMRSPVTAAQWQAALAEDGTLLHSFQVLVEHIAEKGMEQDARSAIWPYLLELYTPEQTQADREAAYAYMRNAYISLLRTCQDLEASFVDATTMRHQPDASLWSDGDDDGPSASALAAVNSPAKVTSLGQISRADVPQFLQQYWEAQRIIAVDAVRTDLKKHSIKGASTGSGKGSSQAPAGNGPSADAAPQQQEVQRADSAAAPDRPEAAVSAASSGGDVGGGGGGGGDGGVSAIGPSAREALANWFTSAKTSLREKMEGSTLYKRYQQQQAAQQQEQQAEAQGAAAQASGEGSGAASIGSGQAAASAPAESSAAAERAKRDATTSAPAAAATAAAAAPLSVAQATLAAVDEPGRLQAGGKPEPPCPDRHVEYGPECAPPPVSPSPGVAGAPAGAAGAGGAWCGATASGGSCSADSAGGGADNGGSLVWLSSLARFHLDNAAHFSPPQRRQVERLVTLLSAYAVHDPEIGYCQGMSDLALPFLLLVEDDVVAFWCFAALMRKVRTGFVHHDQGIFGRLAALARLLEALDAPLGDKLRRLHADHCHFAYRMVMVVMRRELSLEQVLRVWEQLWADDLLQAGDAAVAADGHGDDGDAVLPYPYSRPAASAVPSPAQGQAGAPTACAAHDGAGGRAAARASAPTQAQGPSSKRPDPGTPTPTPSRSDDAAAAAAAAAAQGPTSSASASSAWPMSRPSSFVDRLSAWSAAVTPAVAPGAAAAAAQHGTAGPVAGLWLSRRRCAGDGGGDGNSSRCSSQGTARELQLGAACVGVEADGESDGGPTDPRPVHHQGTHMRHCGSCSSCAEPAPARELEPALAVARGPAAPGAADGERANTEPAAADAAPVLAGTAGAAGDNAPSAAVAAGAAGAGVSDDAVISGAAAADDADVVQEEVLEAPTPVPAPGGGGGAVQAVVQMPYTSPYGSELFQYVVAAVVLSQRRKVLDECHEHDDVLRLFQVLPRIDVADCIKRAKEYRAKLASGSAKPAATAAALR